MNWVPNKSVGDVEIYGPTSDLILVEEANNGTIFYNKLHMSPNHPTLKIYSFFDNIVDSIMVDDNDGVELLYNGINLFDLYYNDLVALFGEPSMNEKDTDLIVIEYEQHGVLFYLDELTLKVITITASSNDTTVLDQARGVDQHKTIYGITKAFNKAIERNWDRFYVAVDLHGTVIEADYEKTATKYFPHAKECLQYLTQREDVILIMYTCSLESEITKYVKMFDEDGIRFNFINCNPDVTETKMGDFTCKPYFNVLFEDKAGFNPDHWLDIHKEFLANKKLTKN